MRAQSIPFAAERDAEIFASLPAAPAVFLVRSEPASEPYIAKTADLRRRMARLLGPLEPGVKRLNLRERCREIQFTLTGSDFESRLLLFQAVRQSFPRDYRERLKLRGTPLIKLNLENPYPRAYFTRRMAKLRSPSRYYGPFPSRAAAEKFLNAALDFFKMRRCDFELVPDPSFPGCIYSEMKMCLAPCFKGCSDEDYDDEVRRVRDFLDTRGASLLRELERQREAASERLQFEEASALHARMEKVRGMLGSVMLPEAVHEISQFNAMIVQRSAMPAGAMLFRVAAATIQPPIEFSPESATAQGVSGSGARKPYSMESRLAEALAQAAQAAPKSAAELNDHLALLKRWYYSSRRQGEIFFADGRGEFPLRRLVRGIGRVLKGEKPEGSDTEEAHRAYWLARTRGDQADSG